MELKIVRSSYGSIGDQGHYLGVSLAPEEVQALLLRQARKDAAAHLLGKRGMDGREIREVRRCLI